jgi:hypothetical protein
MLHSSNVVPQVLLTMKVNPCGCIPRRVVSSSPLSISKYAHSQQLKNLNRINAIALNSCNTPHIIKFISQVPEIPFNNSASKLFESKSLNNLNIEPLLY